MRTGIMGGTFDPIHHGHLILAQEVMYTYALDRVVFVPSKIGPHKRDSVKTSPAMRLLMVQRAIADHLGFDVSDIELQRSGISYTIDTINAFQAEYQSDFIYFITGADAITTIESWRNYKELLLKATFIAATRPSLRDARLKSEIDRLNHSYDADIRMMDMLSLEISSSDIRRRVAQEKPIKYLVPKCVEDIIVEQQLYGV